MEKDLYVRVSARELYRNPWLAVEAHEIVHPSGEPGEHVLIVTPRASAVVVEDGGDLIFARQPRFGARRNVVEVVKGGQDQGETALDCARRELREELGIVARSWTELGDVYEIPSIVSDAVALFVARDLDFRAANPEREERIEPVRMKLAEAVAAAVHGPIDDAVTVAALFRYAVMKGLLVRPS